MGQQEAKGFVRLKGIAAPYLKHDVAIDYIAVPTVGLHDHGRGGLLVHQHGEETSNASVQEMPHAFEIERYFPDGAENPYFILNQQRYRSASILLTGRNFGVGGTHTLAAKQLLNCGIRAVIAPSFGTVFFEDCVQSGLLPIVLGWKSISRLAELTEAAPGLELTIDLERQVVWRTDIEAISFQMDQRIKRRFMLGLKDEDETLPFQQQAEAFEKNQRRLQPWIYQSNSDNKQDNL